MPASGIIRVELLMYGVIHVLTGLDLVRPGISPLGGCGTGIHVVVGYRLLHFRRLRED